MKTSSNFSLSKTRLETVKSLCCSGYTVRNICQQKQWAAASYLGNCCLTTDYGEGVGGGGEGGGGGTPGSSLNVVLTPLEHSCSLGPGTNLNRDLKITIFSVRKRS
jgi:hypothetical protein